MCSINQLHQIQLKRATEQAEQQKYLLEKNKAAAKEQLFKIKLLLSKNNLERK